MFLGRRHQGLDDVNVPLAAVGQQLYLEAVVAESLDIHSGSWYPEPLADLVSQTRMCAAREYDDTLHTVPSSGCHQPSERQQQLWPSWVCLSGGIGCQLRPNCVRPTGSHLSSCKSIDESHIELDCSIRIAGLMSRSRLPHAEFTVFEEADPDGLLVQACREMSVPPSLKTAPRRTLGCIGCGRLSMNI